MSGGDGSGGGISQTGFIGNGGGCGTSGCGGGSGTNTGRNSIGGGSGRGSIVEQNVNLSNFSNSEPRLQCVEEHHDVNCAKNIAAFYNNGSRHTIKGLPDI